MMQAVWIFESQGENEMKVLVSACLLGRNCKYNGGNNYHEGLAEFLKDKEVVEICPEVLAGMPVPRPGVEIVNGIITDNTGKNVDAIYRKGVERALEQIQDEDIDLVVLQSRSPTCGVKQIYDGSFSKKLIDGQGILAKALMDAGYQVLDVSEFSK